MPINLPEQLEIDTVPGPKEATPRPVHVVCFGTWTINTLGKRKNHGGFNQKTSTKFWWCFLMQNWGFKHRARCFSWGENFRTSY